MDIICVSARPYEQVLPSINNFLSIADKVIIARHPLSQSLPINNPRVVQFSGEQTFLGRLSQALSLSESTFVLLAADDDFYIPSSVSRLGFVLKSYQNFSSVSGLTLYADSISRDSISLSPYLISSKILKSKLSHNFVSMEEYILSHFTPLSIDFYTLYNSAKLKEAVYLFANHLSVSSMNAIGHSMKLFQYLFSLSLLLIGDILPISYPLYVRGVEDAMRKQKNYLNSIVAPDELNTFAYEAGNFLRNTAAFNEFINLLYQMYQKNPTERHQYMQLTKESLSKIVAIVIKSSVDQSSLDLLSFLAPKYKINIMRESSDIQFKRNSGQLEYHIPNDKLVKISFPDYINDIFDPFLLNPEYVFDLESFVDSIWSAPKLSDF